MKGGFPNESHNYEEFQLEVSRDIENLKANMEGEPNMMQRWWISIGDTMLYAIIPQIFPGQGDDVDIDYVNVLCIMVGKYIIDNYDNIVNGKNIEEINENTLNVPIKTNRDFIEFLQILLKFSKTTKHFAENNRYESPLSNDLTRTRPRIPTFQRPEPSLALNPPFPLNPHFPTA